MADVGFYWTSCSVCPCFCLQAGLDAEFEPQLRWGDSVVLGIMEMDVGTFLPKVGRALRTVPGAIQYSVKALYLGHLNFDGTKLCQWWNSS